MTAKCFDDIHEYSQTFYSIFSLVMIVRMKWAEPQLEKIFGFCKKEFSSRRVVEYNETKKPKTTCDGLWAPVPHIINVIYSCLWMGRHGFCKGHCHWLCRELVYTHCIWDMEFIFLEFRKQQNMLNQTIKCNVFMYMCGWISIRAAEINN